MRHALAIFPVWVALFSSCSYQEVALEKESGAVNKVEKGKKFRVSLPEDHTSKYLWALKKDIPTTRVDFMGSVFHGTYVDFNFSAERKGREELTFFLYCAKDTLQTKRFVVEVE